MSREEAMSTPVVPRPARYALLEALMAISTPVVYRQLRPNL
jgi:hypothetical protein